jgi:hypothetical protein
MSGVRAHEAATSEGISACVRGYILQEDASSEDGSFGSNNLPRA